MGKKHLTEEQIAFALRQAESGTSVPEIVSFIHSLTGDVTVNDSPPETAPGAE